MRYEFSDLNADDLERIYAKPVGVRSRLNLVIDINGEIAGADGSSKSLTSTHDRLILKLLRNSAEAVVVGANSVRQEGWHIPKSGDLIVISNGSLDELPPCPAPERVRVVTFDEAIARCAELSNWILEGGKNVATHMLSQGRIDQLCLSLRVDNPFDIHDADVSLPAWIHEASTDSFELTDVITDDSMLFTLWRRGINA